jgi:hypothetical protein
MSDENPAIMRRTFSSTQPRHASRPPKRGLGGRLNHFAVAISTLLYIILSTARIKVQKNGLRGFRTCMTPENALFIHYQSGYSITFPIYHYTGL